MKFYFLWIPRTGGTSLWRTVENSGASSFRNSGYPEESFPESAKYLTFQHIRFREKIPGRIFFPILRNPFDRLASTYFHLRFGREDQKQDIGDLNFSDYIDKVIEGNIHPVDEKNSREGFSYANPVEQWLLDDNGKMIVDYLFCTETLNQKWDEMCQILELPNNYPLRLNRSLARDSYLSLYKKSQITKIEEKYSYELTLMEGLLCQGILKVED